MSDNLSVDVIFDAAFNTIRDPRSDEYKEGVRSALAFRIEGKKIACPYRLGTAEADAFFSGLDEGHRRWRDASTGGNSHA